MPKASKQIIQYSSDEDSSEASGDESLRSGENSDSSQQQQQQSDYSEDEESDSEDAKAAKIREQLAHVPFNQLIRIQQQMGTSKFNKSIGLKEKSDTRKKVQQALRQSVGGSASGDAELSDEESGSESENSAPEMSSTGKSLKPSGGKSKDFHRDSRKMPAMMSSKRPVSRFRQVVEVAKPQTRDPRFDGLSGNYNEDLFEKSYSFLDKQQEEEIEALKAQMLKIKKHDPHEAQRIQTVVSSLQSQIAAKKQKKHSQELKRTHRKKELEAVKQGKTPYFLKKRELKGLEAAEKFSKLKDSSKLDNYMEKRRKRNATKDHRRMPYRRREE